MGTYIYGRYLGTVIGTVLCLNKLYREFFFLCIFFFRDPENSLLQNLKDVLEIDFPARTVLEGSVSLIIVLIDYIL